MIRSIQNRIILLIALIGAGMVVAILLFQRFEGQRIVSLLEKRKLESSVLLDRVVDFKSKSMDDYVFDYTYWDEMVNFIKTNNKQWAHDMIEVSLPTFESDYAWVYSSDLTPVYTAKTKDHEELNSIPLPPKELEALVSKGPLYNFYIKTASDLIQISGGSIHPTNDPQRVTPPYGYFFVGRRWGNSYTDNIEDFTGTTLSINYLVGDSAPIDSIIQDEFRFLHFKPLNGSNGRPEAFLCSNGIVEIARDFQKRSQNSLMVLVISLILALGGVSFMLIRFINRPLRALISSLMADDPEPIGKLLKQKSEFGHLAQLMVNFFIQKKKLEEEIWERIKIEKELTLEKDRAEESDRLKSAFLNNISHEIRTPMNAIIGFSELITDPRISEQDRIEFTGIISDSSYRLLGIITDLINISTIESGQMDITEEQFNLNSLLHGIYTQVRREIDTTQVTLKLDVALKDNFSIILTDRTKLNQIILNLLSNSVKFTKSGRIEFGYTIHDVEIEFFVSDTGIGIPLEKFETIFARFQQADDSMSRHYGGTGLGLPICKAYVELLGGRIWLKSDVGIGTQFYFTIPYQPV